MTIFYLHLFFWLTWNLSACLLVWGLRFSHSKHTEEIGTLWVNSCDRRQNRQKVFTFRVYNTTKKILSLLQLPSTETLHHQSTSFIVQPRAAAIWRKMTNNFFLLVCLMTILWLQSHGFQRCVPSLCQSSDFCQLPFRNSYFFSK